MSWFKVTAKKGMNKTANTRNSYIVVAIQFLVIAVVKNDKRS